MTGIMIAQLMSLERTLATSDKVRQDIVSRRPFIGGAEIAAAFIAGSIVVVLVGAYRFFMLQEAMVRGKSKGGGWEMWAIFGAILAVSLSAAQGEEWLLTCGQLSIAILVISIIQPDPVVYQDPAGE